ncbi:MAG: hypothetical protein SBU_000091 [Candidatus Syntrophoarchaeum butanivorans]|uniref:Uncharacterized protein n=1 Tax=Candidatus Syntropharchaeum butanivorans TaxID=1839936 RepID=A0A1F2P6G4_9EURY|nr:MAG: hypothetical protein SBU_000091 [Candidatus Syntrophoarchaeum butanivorans]
MYARSNLTPRSWIRRFKVSCMAIKAWRHSEFKKL